MSAHRRCWFIFMYPFSAFLRIQSILNHPTPVESL